jgi:hypothetical protein
VYVIFFGGNGWSGSHDLVVNDTVSLAPPGKENVVQLPIDLYECHFAKKIK